MATSDNPEPLSAAEVERIKEREYARGWNDGLVAIKEAMAPCTYRGCGRPRGDKSVHVEGDERMRRGAHVWRNE